MRLPDSYVQDDEVLIQDVPQELKNITKKELMMLIRRHHSDKTGRKDDPYIAYLTRLKDIISKNRVSCDRKKRADERKAEACDTAQKYSNASAQLIAERNLRRESFNSSAEDPFLNSTPDNLSSTITNLSAEDPFLNSTSDNISSTITSSTADDFSLTTNSTADAVNVVNIQIDNELHKDELTGERIQTSAAPSVCKAKYGKAKYGNLKQSHWIQINQCYRSKVECMRVDQVFSNHNDLLKVTKDKISDYILKRFEFKGEVKHGVRVNDHWCAIKKAQSSHIFKQYLKQLHLCQNTV